MRNNVYKIICGIRRRDCILNIVGGNERRVFSWSVCDQMSLWDFSCEST